MTSAGMPPAVTPTPWNLPNALTVFRIALVPVFGALLLQEHGTNPTLRWLAWGVFNIAMLTDGLDGRIARSRGLITDFGKVVDPIADKALTGMAFCGLSILDVIPWWVTILVLVREIGITLVRFVVIRHGVIPAGRGGKLKTFLQAASLGALILPLWTFPFPDVCTWLAYLTLTAAVVVTVVTGIDYLFQAVRVRRDSERTARRRAARKLGPSSKG